MNNFWILIVISFFALDKAKSVQLEDLPLQTFDELFVEEWWDKDEAEDLQRPPTNFGQNAHHQQNTQLGQIEPNSPDQNAPLTESDHFNNVKHGEEQKENALSETIAEDEQKRKIVNKFHAIKDEFKQKGKYSKKEWNKIEEKIAKHLKAYRSKIYEWKIELGINQKVVYEKEERKHLIEKFDQRKAELKRNGFKNSYRHEIDEIIATKLGLSFVTIFAWKGELGQTKTTHKYSHSEQKELMKRYYEIKDSKIRDKDIIKILKIGRVTLYKWKRQFKRQQFHPNSVDGHSLEVNAAANITEK